LPLHSSGADLLESEIRDSPAPSVVRRRVELSGTTRESAPMPGSKSKISSSLLSREQWIRAAVLLILCEPESEQCLQLLYISPREWRRLLEWLDIGGLALYFLDRMLELQLCSILPPFVRTRLQNNLNNNLERTRGMIAESVAIQREFQEAGLSFAVLKGFSLCPFSVPKPELRHQFDLDFLVTEKSVAEARNILERRGYRLYIIRGGSWEFKTKETPNISLQDMYKDLPGRSVELHVDAKIPFGSALLERSEISTILGMSMPVLSPVDLFLGQGLHAYKHVCSEFSRTAHLLEFRRHVLNRRDDEAFWRELESRAEQNPRASLALGVVTLLITETMGDFAPDSLTKWTVNRLPGSVRLWVETYGSHVVLGSFPGSKLYLLLQREVASEGMLAEGSLRRALIPPRLPSALILPSADEALQVRVRRYRMQTRFVLSRLRFHLTEGLRFAWESYRWRKLMNRVSQ
jgi:putative nucleotidyltransferase-like protein